MPPCCRLLLSAATQLLFITCCGRRAVVYYFPGLPWRCLFFFFRCALLLAVARRCRLAAAYYSPMPPWCCLFLFAVTLQLFIIVHGGLTVVYVLWVCPVVTVWRCPVVAYSSLVPLRRCLLFLGATLLLFITRQCRPVAVYYSPLPPCCLLLFAAAS